VAAALMPLAHHDVVCHLKSSIHCTTCVVGSSGETPSSAIALDRLRMADAGRAILPPAAGCPSNLVRASSGRSPPLA